MTFRVGDIVTDGVLNYVVEVVNGTKLGVRRRLRDELAVGPRITLSSKNFTLVHTDWKEVELWVILWKNPAREGIRQFTLQSQEIANQNLEGMKARPEEYQIISTHKITLPYKDPQ